MYWSTDQYICGRILTQFTGFLLTNTVTAKRDILAERIGLGNLVSVSFRKNGPEDHAEVRSTDRSCALDIETILASWQNMVNVLIFSVARQR